MLIIICSCVVPLLAALLVSLRMRRGETSKAGRRRGAEDVRVAPGPLVSLTEEMTRREGRRGRRQGRSDDALRRRHLAAVLPADARR